MKHSIITLALIVIAGLTMASLIPGAALAVSPQEAACTGAGGNWVGGECVGDSDGLDSLFVTVANTLLFLIGAVAVVMLIIGGFRYVVSAGDSSAIESAKNTVMYAIIGIVVAFLAFAAVNFLVNRLESGTSDSGGVSIAFADSEVLSSVESIS